MEIHIDSLLRQHNHSVALAYGIVKHSDFMTAGISNVLKKTISYVTKSDNPLVMEPFYEGAYEWAAEKDELWLGLLAEAVARHDDDESGNNNNNNKESDSASRFLKLALGHFWRALGHYMDRGIPRNHHLCVTSSMGVVRCGRYFDGKGCEVR